MAASMPDSAKTVEVELLGRTYRVACEDNEREALMQAVAYLDGKMNEIRRAGKVMGAERIAVMAALNLAHEFRRGPGAAHREPAAKDGSANVDAPAARRRIASMRTAIDQALAGSQEKLI